MYRHYVKKALRCSCRSAGVMVAMTFILSGCANRTHIDSVKEPGYSITSDNLLVIEQMVGDMNMMIPMPGGDIQKSFNNQFPKMLADCGVSHAATAILPIATSHTQEARDNLLNLIQEKIKQNGSDLTLQVTLTSTSVLTQYGSPRGIASYNYEITLQNLQHKNLWKSIVTLSPETNLHSIVSAATDAPDLGTVLAQDIIVKMKEDSLLTKCPAE